MDAQQISEALGGRKSGNAEQILSRLDRVKEASRPGEWWASCPCSDHGKGRGDRSPSLHITEGDEGKILMRCAAGCSNEDVLNSIGLGMADLFLKNGQQRPIETTKQRKEKEHAETVLAVAEADRKSGKDGSWNDEDRQVLTVAEKTIEAAKIIELAGLAPTDYDKRRKTEAEKLQVRVTTLDKEVDKARKGNEVANDPALCGDVEPWTEPVEASALLAELTHYFTNYVILPPGAATVCALWAIMSYVYDAFRICPLLIITSPDKRCGKTTLLSLLGRIVRRPLPASNITAAAMFRAVEKWQPTLLVDEADTFLRNSDELRGIINSGHSKDNAFVIRTTGDDYEPKKFTTWCPKAIAAIGKLPPTLMDRAIVIPLRRKRPDETVERLRLDKLNSDLDRKCARWAADHFETLKQSDPDVPDTLNDRAQDNWRPLIAIAELAGGDWQDRARKAAVTLTGCEDDSEGAGVMLLADIRELFELQQTERLLSADVVNALIEMEHRPWPEWKQGKPLTARQMARLLKPFDIQPKTLRTETARGKGYELQDFEDAFSRYLPLLIGDSVTTLQNKAFAENRSVTPEILVTDRKAGKPPETLRCHRVTDQNPQGRRGRCCACTNYHDGACPRGDTSEPFTPQHCASFEQQAAAG